MLNLDDCRHQSQAVFDFPNWARGWRESRIYGCFASSQENLEEGQQHWALQLVSLRFHFNMIVWNSTGKPDHLVDICLIPP